MARIILVGAFPPPYGGVAEFCRRATNALEKNIELFICRTADHQTAIKCRAWRTSHIVGLIGKILLAKILYPTTPFHFNFSHLTALPLFLILPGTKRDMLTLHNGDIVVSGGLLGSVQKYLLRRFGLVHAISSQQKHVFEMAGCRRVILCSTYLTPDQPNRTVAVTRHVLASGYFSKEYNLHWLIEFALERPEIKFSIIGYGKNLSVLDIWKEPLPPNLELLDQCPPDMFLEKMLEHNIYVRMNSVDSMGIGVCDAMYLGLRVIASDVCNRPVGVTLFPTDDKASFYSALTEELERLDRSKLRHLSDLSSFEANDKLREIYDNLL
jgi:glycosyltransferase involved in cell wall biosynthesis